jgi:hypothetical protein
MVFNTTFNSISAISWWFVLLVEDLDKLYYIMCYQVHLAMLKYLSILFMKKM